MKKFNWKKIVAPIAMLVIGLLGGLLGAFILLTAAGVSFTNSTDTGVKTAKTVYNNTTDTTKAVKKVQNAVVSVINYQEGSSSDSLNELYGRIFGGDDSSDSSQDKSKDSDGLQVAGVIDRMLASSKSFFFQIVLFLPIMPPRSGVPCGTASGKHRIFS